MIAGAACSAGGAAPFTATTAPPAHVAADVPSLLDGLDPADTRTVELARAEGREPAPSPVEVYGGEARLAGSVSLDGNGVEGATVRLTRLVEHGQASVDLLTGPGGFWVADEIQGGRYLVQAWQAPSLALPRAESVFISATEDREIHLALERVLVGGTLVVRATIGVEAVVVGETVPLTVRAFEEVDGTIVPFSGGLVTMVEHPGWDLAEGLSATTDAEGAATWSAVCTAPGTHDIVVDVGGTVHTLTLAACAAGEGDDASVPDVAVGDEISVPASGPFPAGVYESSDEHFCETLYESQVDGEWSAEPQVSRGWTLTAPTPIRSLTSAPGSEPCSYTRTA